jgi:hypothetical protein
MHFTGSFHILKRHPFGVPEFGGRLAPPEADMSVGVFLCRPDMA